VKSFELSTHFFDFQLKSNPLSEGFSFIEKPFFADQWPQGDVRYRADHSSSARHSGSYRRPLVSDPFFGSCTEVNRW